MRIIQKLLAKTRYITCLAVLLTTMLQLILDERTDDQFITKKEFDSFKQDIMAKFDTLTALIMETKHSLQIHSKGL